MDLQTALVSVGVCILSAVVVYLISVFGMREKTYEEAIEEQRKRNQEAAQHSKGEKTKKEKKFKKQGKRVKEARSSEEENDQPAANHISDHVEFKPEAEIIPLEPEPESKPPKAKKKLKAPKSILLNKQDTSPIAADIPVSHDDEIDASDSPPAFIPKDELERRQSMDIGQKKLASLIQNNVTSIPEPPTPVLEVKPQPEVKSQPEVIVQAEVKVEKKPEESAAKKGKKMRSESFESVEVELSFKKLLGAIKKLALGDDEIQTLIDILLNKQQGGTEWTKKNDPVATLKKQLAEREAALESEQRLSQAANGKLRELRQELSQEKSKASSTERSLRQELQTIHARIQATLDQQTKAQQSQAKANDEHSLSIQRLSEEKVALQQQLQHLEVERQKWVAHERDVQRELEDRYQASLAQEQERMNLQLQSKDSQLQQVMAAQQKGDFQCSQAIAELKQQLQEVSAQRATLAQELEDKRSSVQQILEEKEMTIRKQEVDLQIFKNMAEDERLNMQGQSEVLQGQLKNASNQLQDYDCQMGVLREEVEALGQQLAAVQQQRQSMEEMGGTQAQMLEKEKALLGSRLDEKEEALKLSQAELASLHQELEAQKTKNNELRERNWKVMDALGSLEKSSKEVELTLNKEVDQARQVQQEALQQLQRLQEQKTTTSTSLSQQEIQRLREEDRSCLQRILPDVELDASLEHLAWLQSFSEQVRRRLSSVDTLRAENSSLALQVHHYQTVLSETESMLKKLQSGVESQESMWTQRVATQEEQMQKILQEKSALEEQLQQLQGIEEATAEMQGRLKELQAKLQGEESDRKTLEAKTDEALQRCSDLTSELEGKSQELERLRKEQETLDRVNAQVDLLQKDLDKEKKLTKELGSQAVKLNALLKIGQDALKAEQELVKQLQIATTATNNNSNGNNNNNNNNNNNKIPAANGTAVEAEGASGKK